MQEVSFEVDLLGTSIPCHYIKTASNASLVLNKLMEKDCLFAVDTETSPFAKYKYMNDASNQDRYLAAGLSPHLAYIRLIQVFDGKNSFVFDMAGIQDYQMFIPFLETKRFVAHNALFDLSFFKKMGVRYMNIGCTYLISKILFHAVYPSDEGLSASLGAMVEKVLGIPVVKALQVSDWSYPELTFEQVQYAALDAVYVYKLAEKLVRGLDKFNLNRYYQLIKAVQHPVAEMQLNGLKLDIEAHKKMIDIWRVELYKAKTEVLKMTGLKTLTAYTMASWLEENLEEDILLVWPRTENEKLKTDAHTFSDFSWLDVVKPFTEFQKKEKLTSAFGYTLLEQINPETKKLHASFNICGARTGRFSCSKPNCFSSDTEVLTYKGWIKLGDLDDGIEVAQWKDGIISFVKPLSIVYHTFSKEGLLNYVNQHIDLKVTKDHRCLLQHRKTGEYKIFLAEDYKSDYKQLNAGYYSKWHDLPIDDAFIKLLVAVQADGSWSAGGIDFSFYKTRKSERLIKILNELHVPYSTIKSKDIRRKRFRVLGGMSGDWVEKIKEFLGEEKCFGWWILQFSRRQLKLFCEEIMHWDGLFTRKTNYNSCQEINTDIVQTAFTLINKRAHFREYQYKKFNKSYQVDVTHKRNYSLTSNIKRIEPKKGGDFVSCVEVPSSYLLIRRNKKICITGNCQQLPRDQSVKRNFIPSEGNVFVCADFSQIELRVAAELSQDRAMLEAYRQGIDLHALTASKILHKPLSSVTKEDRQFAKAFNFGLLFGLGIQKFSHYARKSYGVEVTKEEAGDAIRIFRETYSGYREWQLAQADNASVSLSCVSPCGKYRCLPEDNTFGNSMNHPVQGGAAEIMDHALIRINDETEHLGNLVNCVHDEVKVECEESLGIEVKVIVEECMINAYRDVFPNGITKNLVEAKIGKSWGDAK